MSHNERLDEKAMVDSTIADLEQSRQPREPLWRELDRYFVPGMARFELTDGDQDPSNENILDSVADLAFITAENGMVANVTNPSQPWIKLKPGMDPDLAEYGPAAVWFDDVAQIMLDVIEDSGAYDTFQNLYGYGLKFSNSLMWMEESYDTVISTRAIPIGQWWIGKDAVGEVNTLYRKFRMSVRNVVMTFGRRTRSGSYDWSNFSSSVREAWDKGQYQTWVEVGHLVQPNDRNGGYATGKAFRSCYFELGGSNSGQKGMLQEGTYLRESGYDQIPAFCFQWHVTGDDIYGLRCPAYTALPDNRELQHWSLKTTTALDKMVDPPTFGAAWTKSLKVGHLPGQHTAVQDTDLQRGGIRRLYEQDVRLLDIDKRVERLTGNINQAFYVDVFRMLDNMQDRQRTATEIAARQQEKLVLMVGMLNRLNKGVLNPFTDRLFNFLLKQGRLPPPPPELEGQQIKVEYVSMMAQAMRSINMGAINRVLETAITMSEVFPAIWNKVDAYQAIDEIAKAGGAPARIIRGDEQVAQIEAEQQKQQQAAQQMEAINSLSGSVKNLAKSPTAPEEPNALTDLVKGLSGNAA